MKRRSALGRIYEVYKTLERTFERPQTITLLVVKQIIELFLCNSCKFDDMFAARRQIPAARRPSGSTRQRKMCSDTPSNVAAPAGWRRSGLRSRCIIFAIVKSSRCSLQSNLVVVCHARARGRRAAPPAGRRAGSRTQVDSMREPRDATRGRARRTARVDY